MRTDGLGRSSRPGRHGTGNADGSHRRDRDDAGPDAAANEPVAPPGLPSALLAEIERQNPLLLEQITVVDFNPNVYQTLLSRGLHVIYGDISNVDTLLHAGIGKSEMIILSVPDALLKGASNEKLIRHVRNLNPNALIVATADLLSDVGELYEAGASYVTVTRLSDAHELFTVIEAAQAGLLADKRAELDQRLSERREVLP